jgi:hypothetical protein
MSKMYSKYTRDNVRMRIQNEKRRDDGILGFYRPMSELRHKVTSPHGIFNKVSAARVEHEAFFGPAQLNFFFFFFLEAQLNLHGTTHWDLGASVRRCSICELTSYTSPLYISSDKPRIYHI